MPRVGTGRVYQRGETWWIDYGFRGERYRESSGSTKKADANKLLRKRLAEMGTGKLVGPDEERVTFEDLAGLIEAEYKRQGRKSLKRLSTSLKHLRAAFAQHRALDVTTARLESYVEARQAEGAANASIQKELAALKRMFSLARRANMLSSPPHVPSVKVQNTREGFFSWGEVEKVIAELPEPLRPVVRFAALTGWRKSEVLGLQWSRVDFEAGVIRLAPGTTKNDQGREVPFRALTALSDLLESQREHTRAVERETGQIIPWVFHRDGKPIQSMRGAWNAACKRAGLAGWLFHDLRRSAVRNLERAGVSRSVATKITGHQTESVYRRYAIADRASMEEGLAKLDRLTNAEAGEPSMVVRLGVREARVGEAG